jgi:hypothetical protein
MEHQAINLFSLLHIAPMYSPQNGGLARECKDVKITCVHTGSYIGRKIKKISAAAQFLTTSVFRFHWNKILLASIIN